MSRVKMPHNNRVSSSVALKTNSMWSKTIGFDPYAPTAVDTKREEELADQAASVLLIAKMSNISGGDVRGGCKKYV